MIFVDTSVFIYALGVTLQFRRCGGSGFNVDSMSNMPRQTEPAYQDGLRYDEWEVVASELVFEPEP